MESIDIFNGDADGICALTQLRNFEPRDARLITGVKRDISLVAKAGIQADDQVTILDISMDKNRDALLAALDNGAKCFYADHHFPGDIPEHPNLQAIIDTNPNVCTSLLVNQHLSGQFVEWALAGAFGDNLDNSARSLAEEHGFAEEQIRVLKHLGTYINYNGYGAAIEDLHFDPAELYRLVSVHRTPFDFIADNADAFNRLETGYQQDMANARSVAPLFDQVHAAVYLLPNESWARRVSGVFGNELANGATDRAHAVVTERKGRGYLISVRAPLDNKTGADEICRQFPTGGGRKAAAGINELPEDMLEQFIKTFSGFYRD